MYVSHILTDVENLGPGKRVCVWFCGCSKNCKGCCSPELQSCINSVKISPEMLADIVNFKVAMTGASGITLSGGDPLEQEEITVFLSQLNTRNILIFTGYTYKEICQNGLYSQIKEYVAAIKCGRYVRELDAGHPLMGSSNQIIIYSSPFFEEQFTSYIMTHGRDVKYYRLNDKKYFTGLPGKGESNYAE